MLQPMVTYQSRTMNPFPASSAVVVVGGVASAVDSLSSACQESAASTELASEGCASLPASVCMLRPSQRDMACVSCSCLLDCASQWAALALEAQYLSRLVSLLNICHCTAAGGNTFPEQLLHWRSSQHWSFWHICCSKWKVAVSWLMFFVVENHFRDVLSGVWILFGQPQPGASLPQWHRGRKGVASLRNLQTWWPSDFRYAVYFISLGLS